MFETIPVGSKYWIGNIFHDLKIDLESVTLNLIVITLNFDNEITVCEIDNYWYDDDG